MGVGMAVAFPSGGSHKNEKVNVWSSNASIADTERDGKAKERQISIFVEKAPRPPFFLRSVGITPELDRVHEYMLFSYER
jgi:hypothetical protein